MNEIIVGDNGTVMEITIQDDSGIVDIRGATVEILIKLRAKRIVKQAQITDGAKGKCQFELMSSDTEEAAVYMFQAKVTFGDGKVFSSSQGQFTVKDKL